MPFVPKIRKYLLHALDDSIIPVLQSAVVPQILAGPPWDFSGAEHGTVSEEYLPHKPLPPTRVSREWVKKRLVAGTMPYIAFVYDGISDDKVGIPDKMAEGLDSLKPRGITALRMHAPSVICFPAGVPRRDGRGPFCEKSHPGFAGSRTLRIRISPDEFLVSYCESNVDSIFVSHSLQIKDHLFTQMTFAYVDELRHIKQEGSDGAQGLLLCIMKRLRRIVATQPLSIGNTAYPPSDLTSEDSAQSKSEQLCVRAIQYINLHLQSSITWEVLATEMGVSPFYLNHAFRKTMGISVIRYHSCPR